jgi:hypothetical protein
MPCIKREERRGQREYVRQGGKADKNVKQIFIMADARTVSFRELVWVLMNRD